MHAILPHLFRTSRQYLAQETISLQAVLPILMLVEPMLFESEEMVADVETTGDLTRDAGLRSSCRPTSSSHDGSRYSN